MATREKRSLNLAAESIVDGNLALKHTENTISKEKNCNRSLKQEEMFHVKKRNFAYAAIKRCFDFLCSLCLSIVLLLPLLILAFVVVIVDCGNPFYVQKRVGYGGKTLKIVKLRSMKKKADDLERILTPEQLAEYHREYKLDDDPRLIGYKKPGDSQHCFGGIIRKMSLDEIPQIFWNICIKGNMSMVGPRPILRDELEENYTRQQQEVLLSVKPGLTGYWQAYARNNATYRTGERQRMELYYVQRCSLKLDMKILFATIGAVLNGRGAK